MLKIKSQVQAQLYSFQKVDLIQKTELFNLMNNFIWFFLHFNLIIICHIVIMYDDGHSKLY